ncbi:MAG: GTP cyclohydrolase I FolE2 [Verrucomicrobia bacterium]|nr:GTP cyclohydrolase I FolE2 [Verrucomicrobiota bacterium]
MTRRPKSPLSSRELSRRYDKNFKADDAYRATLPDMQNKDASQIQGANVPIQHVGISGFRLPMLVAARDGKPVPLECTITGTVSLAADRKGINMSRIMRTFYEFKDRVLSHELLEEILIRYKKDLDCSRARILVELRYPILQKSLRSGLEGWQYYRAVMEGTIDDLDRVRRYIHLDFVYSSACPCSAELTEHAREEREVYGIPHSQRSKARVVAEVSPSKSLFIEDMQELCLAAIHTETQVMVKREDEQAFAELNGAYSKFVEDAARVIYEQFDRDLRVRDFVIACSHLESLHSHDAVSVINKGMPSGLSADFSQFRDLIC